jgi:hypothetical protein
MKTLSCPEVEALIELYAAHECDSAESQSIRAHLTTCASCQDKLAEARRVLTHLDLHYRADAALAHLHRRIEAEAHPHRPTIRRLWPGTQRFAAVAALMLVTVGLWLGLGPVASPPTGSGTRATFGLQSNLVVLATRSAPQHVGAMEVNPPPKPKPATKFTMEVVQADLGGKSLSLWKRDIEAGEKTGYLPLPPRVPLEMILRNPGSRTLVVVFTSDDTDSDEPLLGWRLDVRGPGVVRLPVKDRSVPRMTAVKVPPTGTKAFKLERLEESLDGRTNFVYLTTPGDYLLKVSLRVLAWPEGANEQRQVVTLTGGPVLLRVEDKR